MLYFIRATISAVLFSIFGYACPALNSVKAVVSEDIDSIREYMTYWVVLSIFTCIGSVLHAVNFFKHYSPEMKVIFVMWLTLPRFQGAYRIYTLFLRCFYSKYEDEIDQKVDELSGKIRSKVWQKLKMVCWILFISSNDSLLESSSGSKVNQMNIVMEAMSMVQNQWIALTGSKNARFSSFEPDCGVNKDEKACSTKEILNGQSRLLNEFVDMLERGIFLDVACVNNQDEVVLSSTKFASCRIFLCSTGNDGKKVLEVVAASNQGHSSQRFSVDESLDLMMQADIKEGHKNRGYTSLGEDGVVLGLSLPLDLIQDVDEVDLPNENGRRVVLEAKIGAKSQLVIVRASDIDEGYALAIGLQILITEESRRRRRKRCQQNVVV